MAAVSAVRALRLWPGVALALLIVLLGFVLPSAAPDWEPFGVPTAYIGMIAGLGGGLAVLLWWLLASRASWPDRVGAVALMTLAIMATSRLVHPSIANGMMGLMLPFFAIPWLGLSLVAWAVGSRRLSIPTQRLTMAAAILLTCAAFTLIRTGGITGDAQSDLHWRWTPTPEEQLLAASPATASIALAAVVAREPAAPPASAAPSSLPPSSDDSVTSPVPTAAAAPAPLRTAAVAEHKTSDAPTEVTPPAWEGFRGPHRDGVVRGLRIGTDWSAEPPVELWRRAVGPGWSSFAVDDDFIYTQEQRGDHEVVSCYRLSTGEPVWSHRDNLRFWESNGGAGPRATPTLDHGRVYTLGATGVVNALDARSGAQLWSRNAAADTGNPVPDWGFAGSPLVIDGVVVVALSGQLAAYDASTGQPRWTGEAGGGGYSSPHLLRIGGRPQVLLTRGARTISVSPRDGAQLWNHSSGAPAVSIVQPSIVGDSDLLIASGDGMGGAGIRRLSLTHSATGWALDQRWTSRGLKPYFNDFVVHKQHAFGFDGSILAAINLDDGVRSWKGGRYGHGQLLLLADQDLLLVLSEDGEIALVGATPDQYREISRVRVLEGKTWNHPVLVGRVLLVRNGEHMAAFRLPVK